MSEAAMVSMQIDGFTEYVILGVLMLIALSVAYWEFKNR